MQSSTEFDLIAHLRRQCPFRQPHTHVANGDDASVHELPGGLAVVVSTDASAAGVHWPEDMPLPQAAERAVGAALSDLAAMGAEALWLWSNILAVSAAAAQAMAEGIIEAVHCHKLELAGGDTVQASGNALALTVAGILPAGQAMRRDTARADDDIWLCGYAGHAAYGLQQWRQGVRESAFVKRFATVEPLLDEGLRLRQLGVRCCIDVSDGLVQDAAHVADASGVGMKIELERLPGWDELCAAASEEVARQCALAGGEDYALLFTAPRSLRPSLAGWATRIGCCIVGKEVAVISTGDPLVDVPHGYSHFD